MKYRFYILVIASLVCCFTLRAQDVQRFSERQIIGTARYVGMGGAMTAIGGDPSSVLDNPAGLGLYRRSEIALTIDETLDNTAQFYTTLHHIPDLLSLRRMCLLFGHGVKLINSEG